MTRHFIKSALRHLVGGIYYSSRELLLRLQGKVSILTYHRVLSQKEIDIDFVQPGMYVLENIFENQLNFLKRYFQILSFDELLQLWNERRWDEKKRYCVVTFDDGWLDNYIYAFPLLKKYQVPATIFLPTGFIGTNQWFWPDKIYYMLGHSLRPGTEDKNKTLQFIKEKWGIELDEMHWREGADALIELWKEAPEAEIDTFIEEMRTQLDLSWPTERVVVNWEEVQKMSQSGISFGSHSVTHRILTKLTPGEIEDELIGSLSTLRERRVNSIPVFCYPNGNANERIAKMVNDAGYRAAVTTQFGSEAPSSTNHFQMKRIGIHNDISYTSSLFSFHLSGLHRIFTAP